MQPDVWIEAAGCQALEGGDALGGVDVREELVQRRREGVVIVERLLDLDGIVIGVPEVAAERREVICKLAGERVLKEPVDYEVRERFKAFPGVNHLLAP